MADPPSSKADSAVDVGFENVDLEAAVAMLRRDFGKALGARVRSLTHNSTCNLEGVTLRVHYPSFRDGECTLQELVDAIALYLAPFALTRDEVEEVQQKYGKIGADEYDALRVDLHNRAIELFKKVQVKTKRNGEAGELLLCLLTEWVLEAPQLLAKMGLKTSSGMPVHGSDGIHVRYSTDTKKVLFFWGEAKFYQRIADAIKSASESIAKALSSASIKHEVSLIRRYISLSGLSREATDAIKSHLNPFNEDSNERVNVTTCLIGFDFSGYAPKPPVSKGQIETTFQADLQKRLPAWAESVAAEFGKHGLTDQRVEVFFFPVPSVSQFRQMFQDKIGWNHGKSAEARA